jgi:hypothetical protein
VEKCFFRVLTALNYFALREMSNGEKVQRRRKSLDLRRKIVWKGAEFPCMTGQTAIVCFRRAMGGCEA